MKYTTLGNCPWCDAEISGKGYSTGWAGSPEMFEDYKKKHEEDHPENTTPSQNQLPYGL